MSLSVGQRLQTLVDTHHQTVALIQELSKFPAGTTDVTDPEERPLELATEIHDSLKEQEDALEILRQEVSDSGIVDPRRAAQPNRSERERQVDLVARLTEDVKSARGAFRRAQLQAKRNLDARKRKEREQLFADRKADGAAPPRQQGKQHLTQDELAVQAAEDVTRALLRVHNQLESEVAQSQFAQQTLEESQEALKGLSESYGATSDLLKASRSLVGQLVRSNKSDTWYLYSAFYLLCATIAWLVYRRLIYGPMMLLLVWPLRLVFYTLSTLGGALLGGTASTTSSAMASTSAGFNSRGVPTNTPEAQPIRVEIPAKGEGWRTPLDMKERADDNVADSMVSKVAKMAEDARRGMSNDDGGQKVQEDSPRNTKKRMMEVDFEQEARTSNRDEL